MWPPSPDPNLNCNPNPYADAVAVNCAVHDTGTVDIPVAMDVDISDALTHTALTAAPDSEPAIVPVTVPVVGSGTGIDTASDTVVDTVPGTGVAPVPIVVPVAVPIVHVVESHTAPDTVDLHDTELAAHDALYDTAPDVVDMFDAALAAIEVESHTALDALHDTLNEVDTAAQSSAVPDAVSGEVPAAVPTAVSAVVPNVASADAHDTEPDVLICLEPAATAGALPHAGTVPTVTGLTNSRTAEVAPPLGPPTVVQAPPSASTCNAWWPSLLVLWAVSALQPLHS